jgi:hypothetical protein
VRPAPPGAPHFDRPADVAAHITSDGAVIVAGPDPQHAASLAVAIGRAASATRRVAIGDLVGGLAAVYALAGGEDAPGLAECFRDGLSLNEIARPVPDHDGLFILPAGAVADATAPLRALERWSRLIGGFGEAGGLLVLVCASDSPIIGTLTAAGAGLLFAGDERGVPPGARLVATIGATLRPSAARPAVREGVPGWLVAAAAAVAIGVAGWAATAWTRAANAPDGIVVIAPATTIATVTDTALGGGAADTIAIDERTPAADQRELAPFAVEVIATNTAANANSVLDDDVRAAGLPAATVSVVAVPAGASRVARWHKVMYGAWRSAAAADTALATARRKGVVSRDGGSVVRAPFAVLLADSASPERARAVMDVWRAKGVAPYALGQDNGLMRVYAGAFETVAQAVTMTAMIHAAGGAAIVAYRTGRPD